MLQIWFRYFRFSVDHPYAHEDAQHPYDGAHEKKPTKKTTTKNTNQNKTHKNTSKERESSKATPALVTQVKAYLS